MKIDTTNIVWMLIVATFGIVIGDLKIDLARERARTTPVIEVVVKEIKCYCEWDIEAQGPTSIIQVRPDPEDNIKEGKSAGGRRE